MPDFIHRTLLAILFVLLGFSGLVLPAEAAKQVKTSKIPHPNKERLVLMPIRVSGEDKNLLGAMETALVEGMQRKYEVFSGEQVVQKAHEIFLKESRTTAKKECDETRCMQNIAEAFHAELIATVNVAKQEEGYFLALSIQNIFDNKVVYSKSIPCKNCDSYQMIDKLKDLSGVIDSAATAQSPTTKIEPVASPVPLVSNANDPENALWLEVQKGNTKDDYDTYLEQYPKGKYVVVAKNRIKKSQDELANEERRKEQEFWNSAEKSGNETDFQGYLNNYPAGQFVGIAQERLNKLKADLAARLEEEFWNKAAAGASSKELQAYLDTYPEGKHVVEAHEKLVVVRKAELEQATQQEQEMWSKAESGKDKAAVEAYLSRYPAGRYVEDAKAKLDLIKKEESDLPEMVRIPGKNYEIGKYSVTRGEFAKFVKETGYDAGVKDVGLNLRTAFGAPSTTRCNKWGGTSWESPSGISWLNPGYSQDDTHPVVCVSWNDAHAYVAWLSKKTGRQYRLPNETEWEYACYGGSKTEYCGGGDINAVAWYNDNSGGMTHPVGQKQVNGYGLYDMSGNVTQWMENRFDDQHDWPALRGGSWWSKPQGVRASYRNFFETTMRYIGLGFRLARTLP